MAQSVRMLPVQAGEAEFDPQHPYESLTWPCVLAVSVGRWKW